MGGLPQWRALGSPQLQLKGSSGGGEGYETPRINSQPVNISRPPEAVAGLATRTAKEKHKHLGGDFW